MVELISKSQLLDLKDKYIFHGSSKLFDICQPHKAKCESKNPLNEQNAIYGTSDIKFALLFCFEKQPVNNFHWAVVSYDGEWYGELYNRTYIEENSFGYLYCFQKDSFNACEEGGVQYVCEHQLKPLAIYKVFYKDLFINVKDYSDDNRKR